MRTLYVYAFLFLAYAGNDPALTVKTFYSDLLKNKADGLPDSGELAKMAPHLSARLQQSIKTAQAEQARCIKKNPSEKPPWIEGSMFSTDFEGFTSFEVQAPAEAGGNRRVLPVRFTYRERGANVTWTDHVVVILEKGRWVIDDVRFKSGTLVQALAGKGC
ncbi:MAG: DUF3828 domain-containing protein [Acidobacteria bacterium]|nr:DUF3828 domain-containing protein [Acidobacteriota bacterium]